MTIPARKRVFHKINQSNGAALTEYIITGLLIGVSSISLVMLFGDNVRAMFATTDNSLAGVDSTPATRINDGPLHASLAGLGAHLKGGPDLDKAARMANIKSELRKSLNDPNAIRHSSEQLAPNVNPQVAANLQQVAAIPHIVGSAAGGTPLLKVDNVINLHSDVDEDAIAAQASAKEEWENRPLTNAEIQMIRRDNTTKIKFTDEKLRKELLHIKTVHLEQIKYGFRKALGDYVGYCHIPFAAVTKKGEELELTRIVVSSLREPVKPKTRLKDVDGMVEWLVTRVASVVGPFAGTVKSTSLTETTYSLPAKDEQELRAQLQHLCAARAEELERGGVSAFTWQGQK